MSSPPNPLDYFRSYSYHHILIVCDGTETAEALAEETEITLFDHEGAEKKFCPRPVKGGSGKYIVLINGMSDVQFTIKSAKWSSVLVPNNDKTGEGSTHFRTMAVDGELEISEPLGVNFLNLLNDVTKSLGTDPNGVVYMLKTIFVGHTHTGESEIISNIRPLLFVAYDIVALFDVTGAEYTFSFVGVVNGATRLPQTSTIGDGFTCNLTGASNVRAALNKLQVDLNKYYKTTKNQLIATAKKSDVKFDFDREFINVEYEIIVADYYAIMPVGTATLPNEQSKGDDDPTVAITANSMSVESLIDNIMRSSKEVVDGDQKDDKVKHSFKITSSLHSSKEKYKVRYEVHHMQQAIVPVEEFTDFAPPDGAGIEFDYIFTGKNIDIKDFDIKMNMGMAFFQMLAIESTLPSSNNHIVNNYNSEYPVAGINQKDGPQDQSSDGGCTLDDRNTDNVRKKPLFLGMTVKDSSIRNKRFPGPSANYSALMERHAAFESIEAKMTIRGNPQLIEETTQLPNDLDPNNIKTPQVLSYGTEQDSLRNLMANPQLTPGYVKVNVFMPNSSMIEGSGTVGDLDYSQNFWYPGWYFLYGINHVFQDGEFTQEMEMFSIPTDASQSKMSSESTTEKEDSGTPSEGDAENLTVSQLIFSTKGRT